MSAKREKEVKIDGKQERGKEGVAKVCPVLYSTAEDQDAALGLPCASAFTSASASASASESDIWEARNAHVAHADAEGGRR